MKGDLYVVSAPSGAGKTTLIRHAREELERLAPGSLVYSVSFTTRKPRRGEVEGEDYRFTTRERFEEMLAEGDFLEWAEVYDNYYGTARSVVMPILETGRDVLLEIDVQGAEQVLASMPEAIGIFIMPPSFAEQQQRLRSRGLDDDQAIAKRLAISRLETERYEMYDYVIINDDLSRAKASLTAVILSRRLRRRRQANRIRQILESFPDSGDGPETEGS